jgi:phosphoribosylglycinamide formyltransferase-1
MFGRHVHEAVKKAKEKESGITIHSIDENYDEGNIIFQEQIPIDPTYSASDIAENVLKLEHYFYPRVIEKLLYEKKI